MVSPIMICLPSHRACFERRHVHAGGFDCNLATRDWVSKEVVGAHRSGQMVTRPITSLRVFILPAKINGDLEFRENISIHVQCDFGPVGCSRFGFAHHRAEVVRAQVDFIGKPELRRRDSELVALRQFLENFVAARVLDLKSEFAIGHRFVIGAIQRQRAHMNRLPRLIDGLLGGEQDGDLVFHPHGLGEFRRTDGGVYGVAQLIGAR